MLRRFASRVGRRMMAWGGDGLEAGQSARRLRNLPTAAAHVNALIAASGSTVLARSRHLARNNGYAGSAIESFASAAIGAGIKPAAPKDAGATVPQIAAIMARFKAWTDEADQEGLTDFYGLQARIAREMFVGGECFVHMLPTRTDRGVVLKLLLYPAEMLDPTYTLPLGSNASSNPIRQGIEFSPGGERVAYHFFAENPGDTTVAATGQRVRIPAAEILHIFDPIEAGQIRGLPRLTPAIAKLFLLDVYDDAELARKQTAALFSVFITTPVPEEVEAIPGATATDTPGVAEAGLQPGTIHRLNLGEKPEIAEPADVGGAYEAFQYRTLVQVCAALGLPYASVTGDVLRANYSNMRAALIEARRRLVRVQHGVFVFQFCRPVWQRWLALEVLGGRLAAPGYAADPSPYHALNWIPPRNEWIDPYKDLQADLAAVRAGFRPLSWVIEEHGYDAVEVFLQIAADNEMLDQLKLILDSDPRRVNRAGGGQGAAVPDPNIREGEPQPGGEEAA